MQAPGVVKGVLTEFMKGVRPEGMHPGVMKTGVVMTEEAAMDTADLLRGAMKGVAMALLNMREAMSGAAAMVDHLHTGQALQGLPRYDELHSLSRSTCVYYIVHGRLQFLLTVAMLQYFEPVRSCLMQVCDLTNIMT